MSASATISLEIISVISNRVINDIYSEQSIIKSFTICSRKIRDFVEQSDPSRVTSLLCGTETLSHSPIARSSEDL